jgi:hypothetical protein
MFSTWYTQLNDNCIKIKMRKGNLFIFVFCEVEEKRNADRWCVLIASDE